MGLAILTCQDPNSEHKRQPVTFSTFCSHLHMRTAQSAQPSIQDQTWRPAAGKASFRIWSPGWERTQKAPLIITQLTLRSLSFWGYFFQRCVITLRLLKSPPATRWGHCPPLAPRSPTPAAPAASLKDALPSYSCRHLKFFTSLPIFQQLRTSIKPYLQLVGFLRQLHPQPFAFCHLSSQFLYLSIKLLPLMLRLCLDLLQHLHLTGQLLVVRLQALLVFFKVCFELGKKKNERNPTLCYMYQ